VFCRREIRDFAVLMGAKLRRSHEFIGVYLEMMMGEKSMPASLRCDVRKL